METPTFNPTEFKQIQKLAWSAVAAGWHNGLARSLAKISDPLAAFARIGKDDMVLDLATGDGIASFAAAARGAKHVVASDIAPGHQPFIEATARDLGLDKVVTFAEVDMEDIPYDDEAFDRVISQFGIMFPPDRMKALSEIHRVLKSGGTFAAAVWASPDENPEWYPTMKHLMSLLPPALEGTPHPFNCGDREQLRREFAMAGFSDIEIEEFPMVFSSPTVADADEAWINTGPFAMAYSRMQPDMQQQVKDYIHQRNLSHQRSSGAVEVNALALLVRGSK
jgi:ubiquinone/menaquinone biosynthesis C-methylase UbiE